MILSVVRKKFTGILVLIFCTSVMTLAADPTDYVDPFIGTTNFGTTNPGAVCPNGMMSVSPFNVMGSDLNVYDKDSRWWSTPYCHENRYFTGFSHVNLSGVGCPELGSLLVMPTAGPLHVDYHVYGFCDFGYTFSYGFCNFHILIVKHNEHIFRAYKIDIQCVSVNKLCCCFVFHIVNYPYHRVQLYP